MLEGLPGAIGVGDTADGSLHDAGVGWPEAVAGGFPSELPPLFLAPAKTITEQIAGPRNPSAFEGMDDDPAGIAEDGVVERDGVVSDQ